MPTRCPGPQSRRQLCLLLWTLEQSAPWHFIILPPTVSTGPVHTEAAADPLLLSVHTAACAAPPPRHLDTRLATRKNPGSSKQGRMHAGVRRVPHSTRITRASSWLPVLMNCAHWLMPLPGSALESGIISPLRVSTQKPGPTMARKASLGSALCVLPEPHHIPRPPETRAALAQEPERLPTPAPAAGQTQGRG